MQQLFDEQRIKLAGTQVPLDLGDEVSAALTRASLLPFQELLPESIIIEALECYYPS